MGLRTKFNLIMFLVFTTGLVVTGFISYEMLHRNAREEVLQNAGIMMEAALAVSGYTTRQVTPLLEMQLQRAFLPQSVANFAAIETFNALRHRYPEYTYREAALNPTNPRDRATDWEAAVVQEFRQNPTRTAMTGERQTPHGRALYLAQPIRIKDGECLSCHSTPEAAPATMVRLYGPTGGFGWKLDEIVGAQIVSVPMSVPITKANQVFYTFMGSLLAIFVGLFIVLNLMLNYIVVRPIVQMAEVADAISTGHLNMPPLPVTGKDEVAVLAVSFNRMRRSVEKAMRLLEES
jgi:protein-histidine pros-kinase